MLDFEEIGVRAISQINSIPEYFQAFKVHLEGNTAFVADENAYLIYAVI